MGSVVQLADGRAQLGGDRTHEWRTAGAYRVADGLVAEAWLVPLELDHFDRTWGATRGERFTYAQRVRQQDCAPSTMLGHPRLLEFLEAASLNSGEADSARSTRLSCATGA